MKRSFAAFAKWLIPHRNRVHVAVFFLTLLMIPGALTALQPIAQALIDREPYYTDVAHFCINTDGISVPAIVGSIMEWLASWKGCAARPGDTSAGAIKPKPKKKKLKLNLVAPATDYQNHKDPNVAAM